MKGGMLMRRWSACMYCGEEDYHRITFKDDGDKGICAVCEMIKEYIQILRRLGYNKTVKVLKEEWKENLKRGGKDDENIT